MRLISKLAALSGMLAAFAISCSSSKATPSDSVSDHPWIGKPAPGFALEDLQTGQTLSLEGLRGKYVVLHFATSW